MNLFLSSSSLTTLAWVKGKYLGNNVSKSIFFLKAFMSFSNFSKVSSNFLGSEGQRSELTCSFILKAYTVTIFESTDDNRKVCILFMTTFTFAFNQRYLFSTSSKFSSFSFSTICKYLLSITNSSLVNLISSGNLLFNSFNLLKSSLNFFTFNFSFSFFSFAIRSFSFSWASCLSFSKDSILVVSIVVSIVLNSPCLNFSIT